MTNENLHIVAENGEAINKIAEEQLINITEFLDKSGQEINRRKRLKNAFIIAISSLCIIAIIAFIWAFTERSEALKNKILIEITSKSNQIATKAYMSLDKDPTLAFRLAEQAYKIHPTPLAKQVIMAAYGEIPFYKKLEGHTNEVGIAKFSPDGKYIITGSDDNTLRLWDLKGGLIKIMKGHKGSIYNDRSANFSPDSKYIVTASQDSTARLWDLQGNCLAIMKHDGPVSSACFSPLRQVLDDSLAFIVKGSSSTYASRPYLILTASSDKTARLWDMEGKELVRFEGHEAGLKIALFSPDGKNIVTTSGNTPSLWNINGTLIKKLKPHKAAIFHCSFSNRGNYFITCSWDKIAFVWDYKGEFVAELKGHNGLVSIADFTPDEKFIVTGSADSDIKIWDIEGKNILSLNNHTAFVWGVKVSNNGKYIISNSDDGTARLWDMNGTELMVLKGHTSQVLSANFSPDGKYVVTASGDNTARIWNIQPKENPVLKGHTAYVVDANFSPDGKYIVTAGWDGTTRIWAINGNNLKIFNSYDSYALGESKYSYNGQYILTTCADAIARIWNLQSNNETKLIGHRLSQGLSFHIINHPTDDLIFTFSSEEKSSRLWNMDGKLLQVIVDNIIQDISSYGKYIISISSDSTLSIWKYIEKDSIYYEKIKQIKIPATTFTSVDFSQNNKYFVTTSEDSIARLWKFEDIKNLPEDSIKPLCEYKHPVVVSQPLFSPDSKLFLTVGNDNIVRLFDLKCNVIAELKGHSDAINDINFSPDGKYIVTGSNDNTVRIWDLEGNELQLFPGHKAAVTKVQFSPDGSYILSASNDHTARLMPVSVKDILHKINVEKVRGAVFQLSEDDKQVYGIVD